MLVRPKAVTLYLGLIQYATEPAHLSFVQLLAVHSSPEPSLSIKNLRRKLHEEVCPWMNLSLNRRIVCADLSGKTSYLEHSFNNASHKSRAVQVAQVFWHTDESVHQRTSIADNVLVIVVHLKGVCNLPKQTPPNVCVDELQNTL